MNNFPLLGERVNIDGEKYEVATICRYPLPCNKPTGNVLPMTKDLKFNILADIDIGDTIKSYQEKETRDKIRNKLGKIGLITDDVSDLDILYKYLTFLFVTNRLNDKSNEIFKHPKFYSWFRFYNRQTFGRPAQMKNILGSVERFKMENNHLYDMTQNILNKMEFSSNESKNYLHRDNTPKEFNKRSKEKEHFYEVLKYDISSPSKKVRFLLDLTYKTTLGYYGIGPAVLDYGVEDEIGYIYLLRIDMKTNRDGNLFHVNKPFLHPEINDFFNDALNNRDLFDVIGIYINGGDSYFTYPESEIKDESEIRLIYKFMSMIGFDINNYTKETFYYITDQSKYLVYDTSSLTYSKPDEREMRTYGVDHPNFSGFYSKMNKLVPPTILSRIVELDDQIDQLGNYLEKENIDKNTIQYVFRFKKIENKNVKSLFNLVYALIITNQPEDINIKIKLKDIKKIVFTQKTNGNITLLTIE